MSTARRLPAFDETAPLSDFGAAGTLTHLMSGLGVSSRVATQHMMLFESARPIGGMVWEEWRRRCLNCTREVRGALVTRLPGTHINTVPDLVVTLKDGRTYNVWWETGKGWHVLTCIGGTMHRTRTIDPNGKTGAEVLSVTREAFSSYFVQRPDRLAYEHDMGEVFAPVTHDDGTPDKRYTVQIEGTGTPERRGHPTTGTAWVARFCDEFLGSADYPEQAREIARAHERNRYTVSPDKYARKLEG